MAEIIFNITSVKILLKFNKIILLYNNLNKI